MPKMRKFLFWNEKGDEKETEQLSLTRAVKSVQGDFKDQFIGVEYISKKGKEMIMIIILLSLPLKLTRLIMIQWML